MSEHGHSIQADWRPMEEDVSGHTMGRCMQHEDGRWCAFHHRLGVWVFGRYRTTECLREHPTPPESSAR